MSPNYSTILSKKYSNSEWSCNGDSYAGLQWLSNSVKPTQKQLDDLWPVVLNEIEQAQAAVATAKAALFKRLGITADEAALLLS